MYEKNNTGVSAFGVLQIVFIVLKLTDNINWSWLAVLSPTWIWLAIVAIILIKEWLYWKF